MTAKEFIETLSLIESEYGSNIPKREIFSLAKQYEAMPIHEVAKLLKNKNADCRLAAVSILDWKARNKKTSDEERKLAYRTYLDNHKWIDDWGMVDRAAPYVVGGYLFDKDRSLLYLLAKSMNAMERRTAIVSTYYFIRKGDIEDTLKIAELLVYDEDEYVQMAVGSWLREAGKKDVNSLRLFLNKHAPIMHRKCLRYAVEKLDDTSRKKYLNAGKK